MAVGVVAVVVVEVEVLVDLDQGMDRDMAQGVVVDMAV